MKYCEKKLIEKDIKGHQTIELSDGVHLHLNLYFSIIGESIKVYLDIFQTYTDSGCPQSIEFVYLYYGQNCVESLDVKKINGELLSKKLKSYTVFHIQNDVDETGYKVDRFEDVYNIIKKQICEVLGVDGN